MAEINASTAQSSVLEIGFSWYPVEWTWWLCAQLVLAVTGVIGNSLIIGIYSTKLSKASSINVLIKGLAVADLITSINIIPMPDVRSVPRNLLGKLFCKVVYTQFFFWLSIRSSVFTLATMSIEQCIAILFPLKYRMLSSDVRPKLMIVAVWLMSTLLNTVTFLYGYADIDTGTCETPMYSYLTQTILGMLSVIPEYVIPVIVMVMTHTIYVRSLNTQTCAFATGENSSSRRQSIVLRAQKKLLTLLFVVVVMLLVCWSPTHIAFFAYNIGLIKGEHILGPVDRAFTSLAFVNSCANPFIYTATNSQFRGALVGAVMKRAMPKDQGTSNHKSMVAESTDKPETSMYSLNTDPSFYEAKQA